MNFPSARVEARSIEWDLNAPRGQVQVPERLVGQSERSCPREFPLFSCSHDHLTAVGMGDLEGAPVVQGHPKGLLGHSTPSTRRRRKSRTGRKEEENARCTRWMGEEEGEMKKNKIKYKIKKKKITHSSSCWVNTAKRHKKRGREEKISQNKMNLILLPGLR